jgi:hypothetical protein
MVTARRALLAIGVAAVLQQVPGCINNDQTGAMTPTEWAAVAGPDLNCPGQATVRAGWPQYYDITGDGVAEGFVDLVCAGAGADSPDQVEVFGGTSRSSRIERLTSVAAPPDQQIFLAHGCVYFTGNKVVVIGRMRGSADSGASPTVLVAQVSTPRKGGMDVGEPVALEGIDELPPGCA